jgi:hypothetical protein
MNRSNCTRPSIGEQDGNAVSGANGHGDLRAVGNERVAGWPLEGRRQPAFDHPHIPAMDLMRRDDSFSAEGSREESPIVAGGQRHGTRREHVRGDRVQRPAFEHEPA